MKLFRRIDGPRASYFYKVSLKREPTNNTLNQKLRAVNDRLKHFSNLDISKVVVEDPMNIPQSWKDKEEAEIYTKDWIARFTGIEKKKIREWRLARIRMVDLESEE